MRGEKGYAKGAVEKGGDVNGAKKQTLTERQKAFCRLCAVGVKPIAAAKELGYRNVYRSTGDMLRNERIQREIARLKEAVAEPTTAQTEQMPKTEEEAPAEKDEILGFLTEVMRDNEEADLKTRMKAAELLGKRESLFEKGRQDTERCRVVIVDDLA